MPPSTPIPRLLHSPQKTNSRIVLVETNNSSNNSVPYQRYTLQEVVNTSPTYYGSASLSPRSSVASTISTRSDRSSLSQSSSFSPPSSPVTEKDPFLPMTTAGQDMASAQPSQPSRPSRPSWTASMDECSGQHTSFMIRSSLPLGWLRPSLSATALLGMNDTGYPSHFVFFGFGQTDTLMDVFGLNGPVPLDGNGISERSFFWQVDDNQQVLCTLATFPSDDGCTGDGHSADESPYLENLTLNRIGVTSILLALPMDSTVNDVMGQLGHINKAMTGLDPQGTWWERLILVFYPGDNESCIDQRSPLVQTTLPNLMQHMPVLPCVTILGSPAQQARRLLYQQACMHQMDHGWWHGSTSPTEETSDSSDDDDGLLLPVAIMIGNKPTTATKKKSPLFTVDTPSPSYAFLSNPPPSSSSSPVTSPTVELKHRFSKKWTVAPRRHYTKRSDR